MRVDVTAVVVNYNSADYCLRCVQSLAAQRFEVDGRPGTMEIIVLDNDSRPGDQARLRRVDAAGVRLVFTGENLGYGPANNAGAEMAAGDFLYILNPDVKVLEGAVGELIRVLAARPEVAAVGPATYMDDDLTLLHPPNDVPSLWLRTLQALANLVRPCGRLNAWLRARRALRHWTLTEPTPVKLLSGASFVTRRAVIERLGLFDPTFPLYYEDTDWFTRVRAAGYTLLHVPTARVVHYFSRSALQDYAAAMKKAAASEAYFLRKHFGVGAERWLRFLNRRVKSAIERRPAGYRLGPVTELGRVTAPPVFALPARRGRTLGEIAGNPLFTLAAGTLLDGGTWQLSGSMWDQLWDGIYYSRLLEPRSLRTLRCWSFRKGGPNEAVVRDAL